MAPSRTFLFCLGFLYMVATTTVFGYPMFKEGDVNTTINIATVVSEVKVLRCTVTEDTGDIGSLDVLPLPQETDNWQINKDEVNNKWIEVVINGVDATNKGQAFTCTAIDTANHTSQLVYHIENVFQGTEFDEGSINDTLTVDFTIGIKAQIKCTVKSADPALTELSIEPQPPIGVDDYRIIRDGNKWIGMEFDNVDSDMPTYFTCKAESSATTANLYYSISIFDGIKFSEGSTNGTVDHTLVTETTGNIRCTIASADPPVTELSIQPEKPPGDNDYHIIKNGTNWIEVNFDRINSNTPTAFQCIAKNNMTTATLDNAISLQDPVPPLFSFGANDTIWNEILTGSDHTFFCDIVPNIAIPAVSALTALPLESPDGNWKVDVKGVTSIEIKITGADPMKNRNDFICIASNGPRTTRLTYQNYVGGAPTGVDATLHSVVSGGKMEFSLDVTDRSQAPARNILVYLDGVTNGNMSLACPKPDNYDNEVTYPFDKFLKTSLSSVRGSNGKMIIYANNSLGDTQIKEISIAVPAESSADAGKIAAGILVPFFIILGGVIAGAVVYYYWKKSKKDNVRFSKIGSSGAGDVEDAKSTYGAL